MLHERWSVEGVEADSPRVPYCFSCSIAARISGTTSEQNRSATASNRVAISRVHLTTNVSGLNSFAAKASAAPERRRLLRADRHGRLQTGKLVWDR